MRRLLTAGCDLGLSEALERRTTEHRLTDDVQSRRRGSGAMSSTPELDSPIADRSTRGASMRAW